MSREFYGWLFYGYLLTYSCCLGRVDVSHYHESLNEEVTLDWTLHRSLQIIDLKLCLSNSLPLATFNEFGLGFSEDGTVAYADVILAYRNWYGQWRVKDSHTDSQGNLYFDAVDNLLWNQVDEQFDHLCLTFSRAFVTKDRNDYNLDSGTTHIVVLYSNRNKGQIHWINKPLQLLKSPLAITSPPLPFEELEIRVSEVEIPAVETTYWCKTIQLPPMKNKMHIIGYEGIISPQSEGIVHHLEVFHCDLPPNKSIREYNAACNSETKPMGLTECRQVIGAWAMGAKGLIYPPEAGFPIGGEDYSPHLIIEIHYNNEERKKGIIDSSGLKLFLSEKLRKYDVGIMELGLDYEPQNSIPPNQKQFELPGFCVSKCTKTALPPNGIVVFASQLHTHLTGKKVATLHFRNDKKLADLNRDDHYSPHYQEIRYLNKFVRVLPGDSLINVCTFDTSNRSSVTLGGISISNEMCLNYIFYYPRVALEVCKSVASREELLKFFRFQQPWTNWNDVATSEGIIRLFDTMEWMPDTVHRLQNIYFHGRIDMSCNASNGELLPGHWHNIHPMHSSPID